MILYNDKLALPNHTALREQLMGNGEPPLLDIETATKNCDVLDLVLVQQKTKRQCKTVESCRPVLPVCFIGCLLDRLTTTTIICPQKSSPHY